MIGQISSNVILTRIRTGLYLPACAFVWSCLSATTAGVTNKETLLVVRCFLGLAEAPFFPGAVFCTSNMRSLLRISKVGLAGWQWLFIIESATGAFFALIGPVFIPDFPGSKTGANILAFGRSEECRSSSSCGGPCVRA
jgi:hypothetical protein